MKQSAFRVFRVSEIQPNPFRGIERYPLQPEKIKALRESIRTTFFWDNLVARIGEDGKPEIAYGHHRLEALRKELGDDAEVRLLIRELDDAMMLRMMVRENMEEWTTNALMDQANVRAVVGAYADGKVPLPPPEPKAPKSRLRYAPSFRQGYVAGGDRQHPYTARTLAGFLAWDLTKVETTLAALELIECDLVKEYLYEHMTQSQAGVLTGEVRKVVYAHTERAKAYEKKAEKAGKRAEKAKTEEERAKQERLAKSALQEAAAERKRMVEQADHIGWNAFCNIQDYTMGQWVSVRLEDFTKSKDPPRVREPLGGANEIEIYLIKLPEYIVHVQRCQALAEQFSPEQMDLAVGGGRALQEELNNLRTTFKAVVCERRQRGAAPTSPQEAEAEAA